MQDAQQQHDVKSKAPILFIFFNRKNTALTSFKQIREYRPDRLYLASDGPRKTVEGESDLVLSLREEIQKLVDWPCEVKTNFKTDNFGCGPNVHDSICWFFANEEQGIVLEDDCVASPDFFAFVNEMLYRYRDDQRIGMISGGNFFKDYTPPYSYLFSRNYLCWTGWASWRSRWANMDYHMNWRNTPMASSILNNQGLTGHDVYRYLWEIEYIDNGYVSSWDWQWYFSLVAQNQMCIFPGVNLVSNIGNEENATHNAGSNEITFASRRMTFPLHHPDYILPDLNFEKLMFKRHSSLSKRLNRRIPRKVKELKWKLFGR